MEQNNKKVALVTGATSGIGEACAVALAKEDVFVIVTGRNRKRGENVVSEIISYGKKAVFCELDVNNQDSVNQCRQYVEEKFSKLDILVNSAGIYPRFSPLDSIEKDEIENVLETNYTSLLLVSGAFLSLLEKCKGTIINIASIAGIQGFASGQGYAYASSKAAVIKTTQMMAKVYAKNVRVNCVCPGVIDTPLYFNLDKEKMSERVPVGRLGEADDVAEVVKFLASDKSTYICGASITVDGGLTL